MSEPDAAPPSVLLAGRYRLGDALGRGGMSTVYRAWDERLERAVAVKVFGPDGATVGDTERRMREARVLAGVSHPHLVTLFDAVWPGRPEDLQPAYLVMELIEGESLRRRLDRFGADPELMTRVARELGDALDYLHRRGIVHRDVKPENILIEDAGGAIKLVDFGIAQLSGMERLTTAGLVLGTAAYLSPEQVSGATVGPETDVYSLGLVLLECLTGRREYPGPAVEASLARLTRDPVLPDSLPAGWRELLASMTASTPGDRPTGAGVAAVAESLLAHGETPMAEDAPTAVLEAATTLQLYPAAAHAAPEHTGTDHAAAVHRVAGAQTRGEGSTSAARRRKRGIGTAIIVVILAAAIAGTAAVWTSLANQPRQARPAPIPTVVITENPTAPTPSPSATPKHGKHEHDRGKNGNGDNQGDE